MQGNKQADYKGKVLIFRAWRINPKTQEKEWAKDHGKRAWPMWVDANKANA